MKDKQLFFFKKACIFLLLLIPFTMQYCKTSFPATGQIVNKDYENPVSYEKNIMPLMEQKCTPCHFPEQGKKKLLNTYVATRDNIEDILYRVQIPATHKDFMPFKSKKEPLTADEIELIKGWVAQGMPE